MIWVRHLARIRYDRLMAFGWKVLLRCRWWLLVRQQGFWLGFERPHVDQTFNPSSWWALLLL
jgi:hypothetical protein